MNIEQLAQESLDRIEKTKKGHVYASIRGVVMATGFHGLEHPNVAFRKWKGTIRLEIWNYGGSGPELHELPQAIQDRARKLLDML